MNSTPFASKHACFWSALLFCALGGCLHRPPVGSPEPLRVRGARSVWPVKVELADESSPQPLATGDLIYVSNSSGNRDLWLQPTAGGPRRLTQHSADDFAPAVSPDGKRLVFVSRRDDAKGDLFLMHLAGGETQRLTGPETGDGEAAWFPDGQRLVYVANDADGRPGLSLLDVRTGHQQRLIERAARQPTVSPDGKYLVYVAITTQATGERPCLWIYRFDDAREAPLDDCQRPAGFPAWGKAGDQPVLLFSRFADDSDGNGSIDLSDRPSLWLWQPDFSRSELPPGGRFFPLTSGASADLEAALVGDTVFFTSRGEADLDIWAMRFRPPDRACRLVLASFAQASNELAALYQLRSATDYALPSGQACRLAEGELLLEWGRPEQAIEVFASLAASSDDPTVRSRALLGQLSASMERDLPAGATPTQRLEKDKLAQHMLAELQSIEAPPADKLLVQADIMRRTGRFTEALRLLGEAERASAPRQRVWSLEANLLLALGQADGALQRLFQIIQADDSSAAARLRAGEQLLSLLESPGGVPTWPADALARLELATERWAGQKELAARLRLAIAERHFAAGRRELARRSYTIAERLSADQAAVGVAALRRLAEMAEEEGRIDEALSHATELLERFSGDRVAHRLGRGLLKRLSLRHAANLAAQNEPAMAIKALEQLLKEDADDLPAWRQWLELQGAVGRSREALSVLRQRMAGRDGDALFLYLEGLALTYIDPPKHFARAADLIQKAVQQDPQTPFYHQTLGWLEEQLALREDRPELLASAADRYEAALSLLNPVSQPIETADLLINLGNVHSGLGNYEQARRYYRQRLASGLPFRSAARELVFWERLGRAAFLSRQELEAAEAYRRAQQLCRQVGKEKMLPRLIMAEAAAWQLAEKYTEADELYRQACTLLQENKKGKAWRRCLRARATSLFQAGRSAESAALFQEARRSLPTANQSTGPQAGYISLSLSPRASRAPLGFDDDGERDYLDAFLARLYAGAGDWEKAARYLSARLRRAKHRLVATDDSGLWLDISLISNQLGAAKLRAGLPKVAAEFFAEAASAAKQSHEIEGAAVNVVNRATLTLSGEAPTDPETLAQELEENAATFRDAPAPTRVRLALARGSLWLAAAENRLHSKTKDVSTEFSRLDSALSCLNAATEAYRSAWHGSAAESVPPALRLAAADGLAKVLFELGDPEAGKWRRTARELAVSQRSIFYFWQAEDPDISLAERLSFLEDLPPALVGTDSGFSARMARDRLFYRAVAEAARQGSAEELLRLADRWLVRRRLDDLWPDAAALAGLPPDYFERLAQRQADLSGGATPSAPVESPPAAWSSFRQAVANLGQVLYRDPGLPQFWQQLIRPEAIEIVSLQNALEAGEAMLTVLPTPDGLQLLWLSRTELKVVEVPVTASRLRAESERLVQEPDSARQKISEWLLSPLAGLLGKTKTIFFVGALLPRLPLEILDWQGQPLLARLTISRLYAPRDLLLWRSRRSINLKGAIWAGQSPTQALASSVRRVFGDLQWQPEIRQLTPTPVEAGMLLLAVDSLPDPLRPLQGVLAPDVLLGKLGGVPLANVPTPPASLWVAIAGQDGHKPLPDILPLSRGASSLLLLPALENADAWLSSLVDNLSRLGVGGALSEAVSQSLARGAHWNEFLGLALWGDPGLEGEARRRYAEQNLEPSLRQAMAAVQSRDWSSAIAQLTHLLALADQLERSDIIEAANKVLVQAAFQAKLLDVAEQAQRRLYQAALARGDKAEQARACRSLGVIASQAGHHQEAADWLRRAVALFGGLQQTAAEADALAMLALAFDQAADYRGALAAMAEATDKFRSLGDTPQVLRLLRMQGATQLKRFHAVTAARRYYQLALELAQQAGRSDLQAAILLDLVRCETAAGGYEQALRLAGRALEAAGPQAGAVLRAEVELERAKIRWYMGDYQKASQAQRKAASLAGEAGATRLEIAALSVGGLIELNVGNLTTAEQELQKALQRAREASLAEEEAAQLNNLGLAARQRGDLTLALERFGEAKNIDEKMQNRSGLAYDLRNLGMVHLRLEHVDEALGFLERAAEISGQVGDRYNEAHSWLGLAEALLEAKRVDEAGSAAQRAVKLAEELGLREINWRGLEVLGRVELSRANLSRAREKFESALDMVEQMRSELKDEKLRSGFLADKFELYEQLIELLLQMQLPAEAFQVAERARARNLLDLLADRDLQSGGPLVREQLALVRKLQRAIEEAKESCRLAEGDRRVEAEQQRDRLNEQLRLANERLEQLAPGTFILLQAGVEKLEAVQAKLNEGSALLATFVSKRQTVLWLVRRHRLLARTIGVGRREMAEMVERLRQRLEHMLPVEEELTEFYRLLIEPFGDELASVTTLGVLAHGPLERLPFSALREPGRGWLSERLHVFRAPSAAVWLTLLRRIELRSGPAGPLLALADPLATDPHRALAFSRLEAESAAWEAGGGGWLFFGQAATEEEFVRLAPRAGIVHLATHGEFNAEEPLHSALLLQANETYDGRLEALEVFGLDLQARLVVLSACQSGAGYSEGLGGLVQAFLTAGAEVVLASLWKVNDVAAAVLLKRFYRELRMAGPLQALDRARTLVRQYLPHPIFWAGFELFGAPPSAGLN